MRNVLPVELLYHLLFPQVERAQLADVKEAQALCKDACTMAGERKMARLSMLPLTIVCIAELYGVEHLIRFGLDLPSLLTESFDCGEVGQEQQFDTVAAQHLSKQLQGLYDFVENRLGCALMRPFRHIRFNQQLSHAPPLWRCNCSMCGREYMPTTKAHYVVVE
eukprot:SAG31_NODE_945_length_10834_cov_16.777084_7_plen_164_part_00